MKPIRTTRTALGAWLVLGALLLSSLNAQLSTACAGFLSVTFTNPTPAADEWFASSVAAMGSDKVLIGAYGEKTGAIITGAAYLFSANGTLLTTFTNPVPQTSDYFGVSVAAVDSDKLLIGAAYNHTGAPEAGIAYLFGTNGTLLTTFTNPAPQASDYFGVSVAAVGCDKMLIGAPQDNFVTTTNAGVAYLFGISGTLLTTFTNPTPAAGDGFGQSVAAVGAGKVLIGAYRDDTGAPNAGAAYLFSTNGTLLTTFTNPSPAASDYFGNRVAAVGSDRVLISAINDDTGVPYSGAAYLFSTNGTLLTTFTNPAPTVNAGFGISVAAVGLNKVLIGAVYDDTGATNAGAAYLFSTNGLLLTTITNPTPALGDEFGVSAVAVGSDKVLIGADADNTGANNAGAAYLFSIAPSLNIQLTSTNTVAVSWPSAYFDFTLQQNTNGIGTVNWSNITGNIQDNGTNKYLIVNPPTGNRFYRLTQ